MFLPLHDSNPRRYIRAPYVNTTLIVFTAACYLVQWLLPGAWNDALIARFGLVPAILEGRYANPLAPLPAAATLVTYVFLHLSWLHLLSNLLFLFIFGDNIEDALGHTRYVIFYFACAAIAAGLHIASGIAPESPLIGASGAIAGVMGAYVVLYPHARLIVLSVIVIPIPLPIPAVWLLGVWIVTQFVFAFTNAAEPVAWWAHIGGVFAGMALAAILKRKTVLLWGGR